MTPTYVVVGASLAGARAVEALRNEGFDGRIILVGAEYHLPYDRPPLSKEVILGSKDPGDTLIHKSDFYSRNDIELLLGSRARRIDTHGRRVELHDGVSVQADKVLLCTGTTPRRPEIPGWISTACTSCGPSTTRRRSVTGCGPVLPWRSSGAG